MARTNIETHIVEERVTEHEQAGTERKKLAEHLYAEIGKTHTAEAKIAALKALQGVQESEREQVKDALKEILTAPAVSVQEFAQRYDSQVLKAIENEESREAAIKLMGQLTVLKFDPQILAESRESTDYPA
ncbi:hypothetical protein COU80_03755 [Candidatus Peregrinibacteria bacterium CG10_big_fil_rev_8_21_14_0_10_55_24]|nr:MAG: hypothetical protein COU80_03755 [Candidatus Peregrinibacteria bacterium CG10_big_fil_rev_8_21_14_0_10_55_24]